MKKARLIAGFFSFCLRLPAFRRAAFRACRAALTQAPSERLLQCAGRSPAAHDSHPFAAGRITKALHHVVPDEVGEQDDYPDPARQRRSAALMARVAPADVSRNTNTEPIEHGRDVSEPIRAYQQSIHDFVPVANYSHPY